MTTADNASNYDLLVASAVKAAVVVFGVKILAVLAIAQADSVPSKLKLWLGFVPHFAFAAPDETFSSIVTWSTIAMASAGLILAAIAVVRTTGHDRQRLWGYSIAAVISLETLALQALRSNGSSPSINWRWSWLTVVLGLAGIILLAVPLWNERRKEDQ